MSRKSKIILICLAVLIIVAVAVTIPLVFIKRNDSKQLPSPTVEVFESENLIVFSATEIKNAKQYVFLITTPIGKSIPLQSDTNYSTIDLLGNSTSLKSDFSHAGIYTVQCYAVAENENNNSLKSVPITFLRTLNLASPRLENKGRDFKWESIPNADYYEIIVSSNNGIVSKMFEADEGLEQVIQFNTLKTEFSLENNILYTITIRAHSDNHYYLSSVYSNQKEFQIN